MIRDFREYIPSIIEKLETVGHANIAVIDPGTDCAIKYTELVLDENGLSQQSKGVWFFKGTKAGKTYFERMCVMNRDMFTDPRAKNVDIYIIESQFESNVVISVGVLIGIITSLRAQDVEYKTKRTGSVQLQSAAYTISSVRADLKTGLFKDLGCPVKGTGKERSKKIKETAVDVASSLCERDGDIETHTLLKEGSKVHDIADALCLTECVFREIQSYYKSIK